MRSMADETSPANLFAAAKSFAMAARTLFRQQPSISAATAIPFYFLAGFAIELGLKAVVLRVNRNEQQLLDLRHDLKKALKAAEQGGLTEADPDVFRMIQRMSEVHKGMTFRYVPDVDVITVIGPGLLDALLFKMLDQIEREIDVWEDDPKTHGRLNSIDDH